MRRRAPILALLLSIAWPAGPAADESSRAGNPTPPAKFRTTVEMVSLNVTVTDAQRRLLRGLSSQDFRVLEDGVPQEIALFTGETVPLDVAVLLDTSTSVRPRLPVITSAALGFLRTLRPGDRVTLIGVGHTARVLVPWTDRVSEAEAAVKAVVPKGDTALFTSIYVALRGFDELPRVEGEVRRQAVVVLSDGEDTSSLVPFERMLEECQRAGVAIYTIQLQHRDRRDRRYPPTRRQDEGEYALKTIARETGARFFPLREAGSLAAAYDEIAEELSSQYVLAYVPQASTRPYRRLQVIVARPGAQPRTRSGYFAVESGVTLAGSF